jgi:hypothetical protein
LPTAVSLFSTAGIRSFCELFTLLLFNMKVMELTFYKRQPYWIRLSLIFILFTLSLLLLGWVFTGFESGYFSVRQLLADALGSLLFSYVFVTSFDKSLYCSLDKRTAVENFLLEKGFTARETQQDKEAFRNLEGLGVFLSEKNGQLRITSPKYLLPELEQLIFGQT